jgi:hypothetical protein
MLFAISYYLLLQGYRRGPELLLGEAIGPLFVCDRRNLDDRKPRV